MSKPSPVLRLNPKSNVVVNPHTNRRRRVIHGKHHPQPIRQLEILHRHLELPRWASVRWPRISAHAARQYQCHPARHPSHRPTHSSTHQTHVSSSSPSTDAIPPHKFQLTAWLGAQHGCAPKAQPHPPVDASALT